MSSGVILRPCNGCLGFWGLLVLQQFPPDASVRSGALFEALVHGAVFGCATTGVAVPAGPNDSVAREPHECAALVREARCGQNHRGSFRSASCRDDPEEAEPERGLSASYVEGALEAVPELLWQRPSFLALLVRPEHPLTVAGRVRETLTLQVGKDCGDQPWFVVTTDSL